MTTNLFRVGVCLFSALTLSACNSSDPFFKTATVASDTAAPAAPGKASTCSEAAKNYNALASAGNAKSATGAFSVPFCEENPLTDATDDEIPERGQGTMGMTNPLPIAADYPNLEHCARRGENKVYECKPSAGSISLLPDGRMLYFNALETTENAEFNVFYEGGEHTVNDQTRVMKLGDDGVASWIRPINNDGGAVNPTIQPGAGTILPVVGNVDFTTTPDDPAKNDGALFCAHLVNMYDGRVLAAGGTDYYTEVIVELEGLKNTRIFNPANDTWTQADPMSWGRWYPTMVTLANGNIFIASGVRKLVKPVYADRPQDSGRNETHTEIFQPGCNQGNGKWIDNGAAGQKTLPLFPRMHLLPNNHVLYTAAGQAYNPLGQSYDEALWNFASAYDPAANLWTDLGIPGAPAVGAAPGLPSPSAPSGVALPALPGFRGSTSSILMPLVPNAEGQYNSAEVMTMGGTLFPTPGSYYPTNDTRIDTLDLSGGALSMSSRSVGALNAARWFGQAILLPTGQVLLVSGADADEVLSPGLEAAITVPELYDPATQTWTPMAEQGKQRTYHNSALLMPDGRVMVGGHSPINTTNAFFYEIPTRSPPGRDASFEIFSPPYMFGSRPSIKSAPTTAAPGETITVTTPDAAAVVNGGYAVLVRRSAVTHLVDGDQRNVVLQITGSDASSLKLRIPSNDAATNQAVVPPGHYMLFLVTKEGETMAPSISAPVLITGADLSCR